MIFQNASETEAEKNSDLLERILQAGHPKNYIPLYKKAIRVLGRGRVEEELGEVRHRVNEGKPIENPSAYFTKLLKERMGEQS